MKINFHNPLNVNKTLDFTSMQDAIDYAKKLARELNRVITINDSNGRFLYDVCPNGNLIKALWTVISK